MSQVGISRMSRATCAQRWNRVLFFLLRQNSEARRCIHASSTSDVESTWSSRKRRWNQQIPFPHESTTTGIRMGHFSAKDPRLRNSTRTKDNPSSTNSSSGGRLLEILEQKRQRLVDRHAQLTSKQATNELNSILQFWLDCRKDKSLLSTLNDDDAQPTPATMWNWIEAMSPRLVPNTTTFLTLIHGIKASKDHPKRRDTTLAQLILTRLVDFVSTTCDTNDADDSLAALIASASLNPTPSSTAMDDNHPWLGVTFAFHTVMTMHCQSNEVAAAERLLRELERLEDGTASPGLVTADTYAIVLSGWAQRGAPREAEYVLNSMMNRAVRSKKPRRIFPTKDHYETCLSAWVKASNPTSGQRAELLLLKMQELHEKRRATKPCVKSFAKVVAAWVNSRHTEAPSRADAILEIMNEMDWSHEKETATFRNTIADTYLQAMKLWSWSDHKEAPENCHALLRALDQLVGLRHVPSVKLQRLFAALIASWAQSGRSEMVLRAENVWSELESHMAVIDTIDVDSTRDAAVFLAMLQVYAKSGDGEKAEAVLKRILHESLSHHSQSENLSALIKVDSKALNSVLLAWSRSSSPTAANRAEALFLQMQQLQGGDRKVVRLDVVSYNALLAALSGTRDEDAARRGMQYFRQMSDSDATCQPTTVTYTKAMLLWSNIGTLEAVEQARILLDEMNAGDDTIRPDLTTYRAFKLVLAGSCLAEPMRSRLAVEIQSKIDKLSSRGSKRKSGPTEHGR